MTKRIRLLAENTGTDELRTMPEPDAPEYIPFIQMGPKEKISGRPRWMLHRTTLFGTAFTVHDEGPSAGLPQWPFSGFFKQNEKRLPATLLAQAHGYFKWAFDTHKTEAVVLITADWDDNFSLFCPEQKNSYAGVSYNFAVSDLPDGHTVVGSIHSHCDFGAFHSGTDTHDADNTDGLHITLGQITDELADVDVMFAFSKIKWKEWRLADILDGPQPPAGDFPEEWKDQLSHEVLTPKVVHGLATVDGYAEYDYIRWLGDDENETLKPKWPVAGDPKRKRNKQDIIRRFQMKATDYMYGQKERAAKLLETDLMILADILKDGGIVLTFDVKTGERVSGPPKNKMEDN